MLIMHGVNMDHKGSTCASVSGCKDASYSPLCSYEPDTSPD